MNKYLEKIAELQDSTIQGFMLDHGGRNYTKYHDYDSVGLDEGLLRLGVHRSKIDDMNLDDRLLAAKLLDKIPELKHPYQYQSENKAPSVGLLAGAISGAIGGTVAGLKLANKLKLPSTSFSHDMLGQVGLLGGTILGAATGGLTGHALVKNKGQEKYDEEFKLKKDIALQAIQNARQELGAKNSVDVYRRWDK